MNFERIERLHIPNCSSLKYDIVGNEEFVNSRVSAMSDDKYDLFKAGVGPYALAYRTKLIEAFEKVDVSALDDFIRIIGKAHSDGKFIFTFGNGGSAAISNHFVCDHSKGVSSNTNIMPRVVSLSSSPEIITALLNDVGSEDIFSGQVRNILRAGDVCVVTSSSGNSPNVIAGVQVAHAAGAKVLGLVGFSGGQLKTIADHCIHVESDNYGIVEDIHHSIMHIIAQYIRGSALTDETALRDIKF